MTSSNSHEIQTGNYSVFKNMNKEPTKDIQEESAKLPAGSSLEFHSSHKSEMKEGHNAISGTFWGWICL